MNSSEQCGHNELTLIDWSSLVELRNAHLTAVAVASAELRMNDVAKVVMVLGRATLGLWRRWLEIKKIKK